VAEKNEEKYRSLFEFMSDGAFYQHADGQLIDVNNAALNLLGVTRDVFLSTDPIKTEWKIIDEQLQPISPDGFPSRMALSTGKPVNNMILAVFNSEKQSYNWALVNAIPQFLPGESTPYRVFVTMHDITEQKRFENKIRESEVNARAIMEATDDVLILLDADGVVVDCNEAHAKRLGLTRLDLLGKNVFDYQPADVGTKRREILHQVIVSGEPAHFVDFRAGFWNEASIYPIFNDQRIATKVAIFSKDITAKKVFENALIESEARLRETNAAKDKFFSIIAHDLKSPFNSILGFSDLLQSEARDTDIDTIVQYAGIIYSSANNTLKLLDNLLIWARLQQGKISFEPKMLVLYEVVHAEIRGLQSFAAQKNIELSGKILENIIITADQNMLSAILRNLITNSIKFTPKNGKVHLSATCEDSQVVVAVSDTGVGMTEEAIGKLFRSETFESTRGTENEKGTGLGLLLCKEFVEKHEGKIWVESQPGNGSVFRFSIKYASS
jgi:PAS domain S-box-containing protein